MDLREIREKIESTEKKWVDIESEIGDSQNSVSSMSLFVEKERLKNLLEDARADIDTLLSSFHCKSFVRICRDLLERLFAVSENLRLSYVFPGYLESFYILDTIEIAEGIYGKH